MKNPNKLMANYVVEHSNSIIQDTEHSNIKKRVSKDSFRYLY